MDTLQKPKSRPALPISLRRKVWNTYIGVDIGQTLCRCNKNIISQLDFVCGHVIALSKNGPTTLENLRPICKECNIRMFTMNMDDFYSNYDSIIQKCPIYDNLAPIDITPLFHSNIPNDLLTDLRKIYGSQPNYDKLINIIHTLKHGHLEIGNINNTVLVRIVTHMNTILSLLGITREMFLNGFELHVDDIKEGLAYIYDNRKDICNVIGYRDKSNMLQDLNDLYVEKLKNVSINITSVKCGVSS